MTPDLRAVLERGLAAKALLASTPFTTVADELTSYHLSALVAAPVGERGRDARDYHHSIQHALALLTAQLQGWVDAGENAAAALEAEKRETE